MRGISYLNFNPLNDNKWHGWSCDVSIWSKYVCYGTFLNSPLNKKVQILIGSWPETFGNPVSIQEINVLTVGIFLNHIVL
jgi:hypothetical protein